MDKIKLAVRFCVLSITLALVLLLAVPKSSFDESQGVTINDVFEGQMVVVRPIDGGQYVAIAVPNTYPQALFDRALKDPVMFLYDYENHPDDVTVVMGHTAIEALTLLKETASK